MVHGMLKRFQDGKQGDQGGGARMRSLALQLSSAGIFVTTQKASPLIEHQTQHQHWY